MPIIPWKCDVCGAREETVIGMRDEAIPPTVPHQRDTVSPDGEYDRHECEGKFARAYDVGGVNVVKGPGWQGGKGFW